MATLPNVMNPQQTLDPAHNFLLSEYKTMGQFFNPTAVAVIGATEKPGSVGRTLFWNLIKSPFGGLVYPVNPKRDQVLGIRAYPDLASLPSPVDVAVVVTPAPGVPAVIKDCAEHGVKSVIIISAGFKETGAEGVALEQTIQAIAEQHGIRIIGPNCLGVMNPINGFNATFANGIAKPGKLGFISQSGALCTAVLDWSFEQNVGFSKFISLGSMLDVDWGDLIYALGEDPHTDSILIYMETVGNARAFLSAAREISQIKPIIIIKPGRTAEAASAAASHTGSLAGSDDVLDAAFERAGVLRVDTISELFSLADVLSKQSRPKGPKLVIVTNAGGPGVLATDALIQHGGQLATTSPAVVDQLNRFLPAAWSHGNPVDVLGDADPTRYAEATRIVLNDAETDGVLVILTPQAMTDPTETAEALVPMLEKSAVPVLASWMGGQDVAQGEAILNNAAIPTYTYPDDAAKTFSLMWQYSQRRKLLYETPVPVDDDGFDPVIAKNTVANHIATLKNRHEYLLSEYDAKQVLTAYHIPTVDTRLAHSIEEAIAHADAIGYPVVLKLHSLILTHKSDVGGVQLNLKNATDVAEAWQTIQQGALQHGGPDAFLGATVQRMQQLLGGTEVILGMTYDAQFGPVILFGSGGKYVEVFKDKALALPPLNGTLVQRLLEKTKVYQILKGVRGEQPADMAGLTATIVRFSQLILNHPEIKELDINPLWVSGSQQVALDARVLLHTDSAESVQQSAIRRYPQQYVEEITLKDGYRVRIRPIRPEDEPLMRAFHETLSQESIFARFQTDLGLEHRINHERLSRICFNDYDREIALILQDSFSGHILGVGRLSKLPGQNDVATFRVLIADACQRKGLGTLMVKKLQAVAQQERVTLLRTLLHEDNHALRRICERLGFDIQASAQHPGYLNITWHIAF
jgi:acetyltransferase